MGRGDVAGLVVSPQHVIRNTPQYKRFILLSGLRSLLQTDKSVRYGWSSGWGRVNLSRTADSQTNVQLSVGDGGGVTFR